MVTQCPVSVVITSQTDIDIGPLSSPACSNQPGVIQIVNATGTLNFTSVTKANVIDVFDSPELKELGFPLLYHLSSITISDATSLSILSSPHLSTKDDDVIKRGIGTNLNITDAPSLNAFYLPNESKFVNATLVNVGAGAAIAINNITFIVVLKVNQGPSNQSAALGLGGLISANYIEILGGAAQFDRLTSVRDIVLKNVDGINLGTDTLVVNNSLTLEDSKPLKYYYDIAYMDALITIASNASITSNSDFSVDLSGLTTLGETLSVINNTNCSFYTLHRFA